MMTLPAQAYMSSEAYEEERRMIFRPRWLLVGHAQAVPSPGGCCRPHLGLGRA